MEEAASNSNEKKETKPEVSLPGSDANSIEQPDILQVLSPLNASEEKGNKITENPENRAKLLKPTASEQFKSHNNVNENDDFSDKNLVSSSHKPNCPSHLIIKTSSPNTPRSTAKDGKLDTHGVESISREANSTSLQNNILDIESHLIETYNELFPNEESVGINELTPIEDELKVGCSKVELNDNVRTIIKVEPAKVVTKKPIEKLIETNDPLQAAKIITSTNLSNGERCINENEIEKVAEKLIKNIEEEITNNWEKISSQVRLVATAKVVQEQEKEAARNQDEINNKSVKRSEETEEIKKTLVSEFLKSCDNAEGACSVSELSANKIKSEQLPALNGKVNESIEESIAEQKLSDVVNQQLSEVNSILESQTKLGGSSQNYTKKNTEELHLSVGKHTNLKIVSVPLSKTASEEEERKLFIESLPALEPNKTAQPDAEQLALDCKREYYQSLKKYLIQNNADKPPLPLQTYRWEDLRRAKERGGYPWTHLYKRPLGPDEQPEIVLMLRKSQEIRFTSESPKSNKKVRIDDHVSIKETERYIQDLSEEEEQSDHSHQVDDLENHSLHSECFSFVSDSALSTGKHLKKSSRFDKVRRLFRRRRYGARQHDDAQSLPDSFSKTSLQYSLEQVPQGSKSLLVHHQEEVGITKGSKKEESEPIYVHSKTARCFPIMKKLKSMADRQKKRINIKRIHLGKNDKIVLNEEPKILKLKNSPKSQRSDIAHFIEKQDSDDVLDIVELDESPSRRRRDDDMDTEETAVGSSIVTPEEIIEISDIQPKLKEENEREMVGEVTDRKSQVLNYDGMPPKRAPRLRRDHVYEEIDQVDDAITTAEQLKFILDATSVDAIKQSLVTQDTSALQEVATTDNQIPLDRMGSSEEEPIALGDHATSERKPTDTLLAPISSIDSASSDEDKSKSHLQPVTEEDIEQEAEDISVQSVDLAVHKDFDFQNKSKPSLKKEASPAPSEKKVTFSHVEDEAEPHREDIELSAEQLEATREANKWKNTNNEHEYEPIATPPTEEKPSEQKNSYLNETQTATSEINTMKQAEDLQKELEDRFFSSPQAITKKTPQMEIEVAEIDDEDTVVECELAVKPEKKSFMASAQDRTRRMQAGFKNQAGKLKTKLKPAAKKIPSGSPKDKERKKFKAPEFSKIRMPQMKRPDMSRFKELKRPAFTKFSKPDMSKFKLPEKMTNIKLKRSKSLKEADTVHIEGESGGDLAETQKKGKEVPVTQKKLFEFNFGTYPRALRKKKSLELESSFGTGTATEATSVVPSTETQPSLESSSTPQGDRGPGPVRSRWADKFSDVSYNDSEGSRYRRYGSEQESFDRESSLERRMRDDLEDAASEETNLGILGVVTDNKQFAEFDEENRAIHEISNLRSGEFKRRPIVHQDSDVRSEDSKDAVGWTERDIQKNTLLRKAERETEATYHKFQSGDHDGQHETQSTASSGKKVVLEEIGDDEFFLRKRGISQDNIEINQYIRNAFRDEYDKPINALQNVGQTVPYVDYDVPPPKPRRLQKAFAPDNVSQEFDAQRSDYGDELSLSHNGSEYFGAPRRPLRKGRSRSKYSMENQDADSTKYMDEEYQHDSMRRDDSGTWNDLNMSEKENISHQDEIHQPLAPRRQKRRRETSMELDSYMNGFGGRSVSNTFLQPTKDIIIFRTEHEYHHVPLATPEKYSDTASTRKSTSNYDLDEHQSRGAISFEENENIQESEKYVIDMIENDGYAVVRKESVLKPTPPARRRKFARSPGERFATMPNMRTKKNTPPPERPPPPRGYTPISDVITVTGRKSPLSLDVQQNYDDDYEEPGLIERNLQSGEIINKMKYRPLPPPPRPPREKRQRSISKGSEALPEYRSYDSEDVIDTVDGNFGNREGSPLLVEEVEACTQTDPLPDDFVCEEFEITDDMKVIEPRVRANKTIEAMLEEELERDLSSRHQITDSEQLAKGLQRFRDANQRSLSERSRASSQADRSKSLSRPQTPSAILVERQSTTPIQRNNTEVVEASLVVRAIDDLELEEEELRREHLLADSSQHSVSDTNEDYPNLAPSEASYAPSSAEIDEALAALTSDPETQQTDEEVERTLQRYRDELDAIGRELMETQTTSQEPSPSVSREEIKCIDKEIDASDIEDQLRSDLEDTISGGEVRIEGILSEIQEEQSEELTTSELEISDTERPQPPPRRKSTTTIEPSPPHPTLQEPLHKKVTSSEIFAKKPDVSVVIEEKSSAIRDTSKTDDIVQLEKELIPVQTIVKSETPAQYQLPARVCDLEVERLRVHALQAGQIMVSQLHGEQISSDDLECKSGNLVVHNIELPPGLIENIVEQVRQKERSQHLTIETQTSLQNSTEYLSASPVRDIVPPPKPPRLRDHLQQLPAPIPSSDEQTQTEERIPENSSTATFSPTVFPTAEYLQSLAPLAFYNMHRTSSGAAEDTHLDITPRQRHRSRHRRSSSSETEYKQSSEIEDDTHHRRRTRSTRSLSPEDTQSVTKAGRKFIAACSFFLCKIINQLTYYIHGSPPKDDTEVLPADIRSRQVPALVVLFMLITFVVLLYLMNGRNIHTHHWDYFNPPGQEGR